MARLPERVRIGIIGLGWVGQEIARASLDDRRVRLVGVADTNAAKAGRDLGEIIGEGRLGMEIMSDVSGMLAKARPEVAVVCTTSNLEKLAPTIALCIDQGAHVVTTCENLADPDIVAEKIPAELDAKARELGLVVLATGVNPGFAMDRLPILLSKATMHIRRVRVARVIDAATRRAQLQVKAGIGLSAKEFRKRAKAKTVGHQGLVGSVRLIAKGLGVTLDNISEALKPIIANYYSPSSVLGPVEPDAVRGIYQIARGFRGGRELITLEMTVALDEPNPRDTIDIVGEPPLHFEGEVPGDICTVANVLSTVPCVVTMTPGLRTVLDVPLEQPEEPLGEQEFLRMATTMLPAKGSVRTQIDLEIPPPANEDAGPTLRPAKARAHSKAGLTTKKSVKRASKKKGKDDAGSKREAVTTEIVRPPEKTAETKKAAKKKTAKKTTKKKTAKKVAKKKAAKKAPTKKTTKKAAKKKTTKKVAKKTAKKVASKKKVTKKATTKKASKKKTTKKAASKKKTTKKAATKKVAKKAATKKRTTKKTTRKVSKKKAATKRTTKKATTTRGKRKTSRKKKS